MSTPWTEGESNIKQQHKAIWCRKCRRCRNGDETRGGNATMGLPELGICFGMMFRTHHSWCERVGGMLWNARGALRDQEHPRRCVPAGLQHPPLSNPKPMHCGDGRGERFFPNPMLSIGAHVKKHAHFSKRPVKFRHSGVTHHDDTGSNQSWSLPGCMEAVRRSTPAQRTPYSSSNSMTVRPL